MIVLKSEKEIELMKLAGRICATALKKAGEAVEPGVTTGEIDAIVRSYIEAQGAKPSFLGYSGYPASACISVNDEVIHGIPGKRKIREGDIVSIDVGAYIEGFHGDTAATFGAGKISPEAQRLLDVTKESLYCGIRAAVIGNRIGDISAAVQNKAEGAGMSVVLDYVGHGVGADLHEAPEVPNYGRAGRGPRLVKGMTIAIEPMINLGGYEVRGLSDNWTVVTEDGSLSAHFEHTIAITEDGPIILTQAL